MSVSIKDVDKVKLLKALWEGAKPAVFFTNHWISSPEFDESVAINAVKSYIDYYSGRCIKTDLSGDTADPYLYDRDWGAGAFQKIADSLRA